MHVLRITRADDLNALAGDWNRLASGIPFRRFEWLMTWWRHYPVTDYVYDQQTELFVLAVRDGEQLIGLAPWYLERSRTSGRTIRFLGSGEVCSDYLSVLAQTGREDDVATALADWLMQATSATAAATNRWDVLAFAGVDAQDEIIPRLAQQLNLRGADVYVRAAEGTWRIELPESWEEYLAMLSKSHRKQLRQSRRRLLNSGRVVLHTVEQPDQVEQGWRILTALHQRRLESLGQPGCFQSTAFTRFHRAVTAELFRADLLRLHWLELAGQPIAAEYQLVGNKVIYVYQGGIEPAALEYAPGRLATIATIEQALNAGFRGFDFCRGDEPYKAHWRAKRRESRQWRIIGNRASARWRHNVWQARESAWQWAKRGTVWFAEK